MAGKPRGMFSSRVGPRVDHFIVAIITPRFSLFPVFFFFGSCLRGLSSAGGIPLDERKRSRKRFRDVQHDRRRQQVCECVRKFMFFSRCT